jgi:hypothetical protein
MDILIGFITNNFLQGPATNSGRGMNLMPVKIHTDFSISLQQFLTSLADQLGNHELLQPIGNSSTTWRYRD